jgi:hypothetical protein
VLLLTCPLLHWIVQEKTAPSGSLIGILQLKLNEFPVEPFVGEGIPNTGGAFGDMYAICKPFQTLVKFELGYAWPSIPAFVPRIQSVPTVVGATSPRNVIEVRDEH